MEQDRAARDREAAALMRRHLTVGWVMLLAFLSLGMLLEAFHGFKVRWYVDLNNVTRRLMWTLAHAHGVLIGLIHIAFAATVHFSPQPFKQRPLASTCLVVAGVLLPGGFLLGGVTIHQGDPGIGVFLTPIGGLLLFACVGLTVRGLLREKPSESDPG